MRCKILYILTSFILLVSLVLIGAQSKTLVNNNVATSKIEIYTVSSGDTLWTIAEKYTEQEPKAKISERKVKA